MTNFSLGIPSSKIWWFGIYSNHQQSIIPLNERDKMENRNSQITEKGYKRQKCSLYLQEKVYKKLIEISEKNELSISECGQRLMVQSMGLI